MAKQKVYVALLLDRSGSMQAHKVETVSAVNSYLGKLQEQFKGRFTMTQFDSEGIDIVHDNVKIKEVPRLTEHGYQPRSMTPLLDAIGKTMRSMEGKTEGFENVIFVIVTDGQENHSKEFKLADVRALIEEKRKAGWEVSYLGANVDAFAEAGQMGIPAGKAMNYAGAHTQSAMDAYATSNVRYAARSNKKGFSHESDFTEQEREQSMHGTSPGTTG